MKSETQREGDRKTIGRQEGSVWVNTRKSAPLFSPHTHTHAHLFVSFTLKYRGHTQLHAHTKSVLSQYEGKPSGLMGSRDQAPLG